MAFADPWIDYSARYTFVISYDPAATSDDTVRRIYDRAQFEKAWMTTSGGIVYVIHPSSVPCRRRPATTGSRDARRRAVTFSP